MTRLCLQMNTTPPKEHFQLAFRLSMYSTFSLFLIVLYSNIGLFLWRSKSPGNANSAGKSTLRKRQAVKMLATATAVMIVSYLPYMVLVAVTLFAKPGFFSSVFGIEVLGNILTTFNHVCNPFIYCVFSSQFREGFRAVFKRMSGKTIDFVSVGFSVKRDVCSRKDVADGSSIIKLDHIKLSPMGAKATSQKSLITMLGNVSSAQSVDSLSVPSANERQDQSSVGIAEGP